MCFQGATHRWVWRLTGRSAACGEPASLGLRRLPPLQAQQSRGFGHGRERSGSPRPNPACLRRGLSCGLGPLTAARLVEEVERYLG